MRKTRKHETRTISDLVALLELQRSSLVCVELAHALGYQISRGKSGTVRLERSGDPLFAVYFSSDALIDDLLGEARRLVGSR